MKLNYDTLTIMPEKEELYLIVKERKSLEV